jgi:hypothetical protein
MGQPQARLYLGLTAAPPARLIEPVAEVFGDLDTQIDDRWQMAAGATDLINEAATSKITGEEERYSHTDLVDFDANMKASMKVAGLLSPYLRTVDPDLVSLIRQRNDAVQRPGPRGRRRARRRSRSAARTRPASSPPPRTGWRSAR